MKQKNYEIYLDMDEVIYPLSKVVVDKHNKDFNENYNWEDNNAYWWEDTGKPKEYFEKVLNEPGIFLIGKPKQEDIDIIKKLQSEGFEINILTAPVWNGFCSEEKIKWLKKYFGFIDIENNVHFSCQKWKFAKKNRILLDDNDTHLIPWEENGGISIAYKKYKWGEKTKNRVYSMQEFYNFVHSIM